MTAQTLISSYASKEDQNGKAITLEAFFDGVRNPPEAIADKIKRIRELVADGEKKEADKIKATLPAVTLSDLFSGPHKADALKDHSGIVSLDFDHLDPVELATARAQLEADPHVCKSFLSPSGRGIKGGCRVPNCKSAKDHDAAWLACERYFKEVYGLTMDPATKDVSRLCFVSYDPVAFANWQAAPLDVEEWRPLTKDQIEARRMVELMELARFKGINNPPPEAAPILTNERGDVLGERGNFIVVQGIIKSGKTGLLSACIAALVGTPDDSDTLGIVAPPAPGFILHFDCEQGARNHFRLMDTIIRKRCKSTTPSNAAFIFITRH